MEPLFCRDRLVYQQIDKSENGYIYAVNDGDREPVYHVFEKRETYPEHKDFGIWAYMFLDIEDAKKCLSLMIDKITPEYQFKRSRFAPIMTYSEFLDLENRLIESKRNSSKRVSISSVKLIKEVGATKKPSKLIERLIILDAKIRGHNLKATNNTGIPIIDKRTKKVTGWQPSAAGKGNVLDITGSIWGESIEIDVKWGKDKLSPQQYTHIMNKVQSGGIAITVGSYSDYVKQLNWIYDKEKYKAWKLNQLK